MRCPPRPPVAEDRRGFSLIEVLIAIAVLSIFFGAIAVIFQNILQNIGEARVRTTALEIGQEKMELIRNLTYYDVGVAGGVPQGPIAASEVVTRNDLAFTVNTSIIYVDDPYDGLAPSDTVNTDYKRVRVEITWGGTYPSRTPMVLITNIAPKGKETAVPGGTLKITVYDSQAQPVQGATVSIDNHVVTPTIHTTELTDDQGQVVLPGYPECNTCYEISVTKTGYSTDRTYDTSEVANPLQPYASLADGSLTEVSFAIDRVSAVTVNSYNTSYFPVPNVKFTIHGAKIIGYDTSDNPVYKYSYTTNTGGYTVGIPALEWDNYTLDLSPGAYTLAGSNPIVPFSVPANTHPTVNMVVVPKANTSLLVIVENAMGEPQASASAELSNATLAYDQTRFTAATGTADFGQAFFASLTPETYDLKVNLPGYDEATASVVLSGNQSEIIYLDTAP